MHKLFWIASLAALGLLPACAASGANGPADRAGSLTVREAAFSGQEVVVAKSLPPRFDLVMYREMPTPGWQLEMDGVEIDEEAGRIVARVSEIGPKGPTAQVITRTPCKLRLGMLRSGTYLVEVHLRRGTTGEHRLAQAFVIDAR